MVGVASLGVAPQAQAATPSSGPQTFTVSSTTGWQKTPVTLKAHQAYTVSYVSGDWTVDYRNFARVGPGGYSNSVDQAIYQGCKYNPDSNYAVLLGTVGDSAAAFPIGQGGIFNASSVGPLYLRINDDDACLGDNAGSVTMYISPVTQSPFGTYAGYTAVAGGKGAFGLAEATWVVPQISRTSCFPLLFSTPWVASWVGLWGSDDSIKKNTAWLPQIGTISACNTDAPGHRRAGRNYWAFWQMFTNVSGGGAQQHGNTPQAIQGMTIEPGDTMTGAVEYAGKSGSDLAFRLTLFDVTRTKPGSPDQFSITVTTTKPVDFKDIAAQAGAVVEPNCDTILGLAKFDTVPFTNVQALPWNGTPEPVGVSLTKWTMTGRFGIKLAEPGTLFGFPGAMNYTVSYHAGGPTAC